MSLIPDSELKKQGSLNLAPLVDFLFLVIAVFATLAVTRTVLYDSDVSLVTISEPKKKPLPTPPSDLSLIHLSINAEGQYKWISDVSEYLMDGIPAIEQELARQYELGLLPKNRSHTKVLLHIDKEATWEPIAHLIFAVRQAGFVIHPVYDLTKTEL